jgi:hypothetical protein
MKMTSKTSKIATAIAFLAVAITGCENGTRIEGEAQFAAMGLDARTPTPIAAKTDEPVMVISHADGKYEESNIFETYDVHGNRL